MIKLHAESGEEAFYGCIFSKDFEWPIWIASYGYESFEQAQEFAWELADVMNIDSTIALATGARDSQLSELIQFTLQKGEWNPKLSKMGEAHDCANCSKYSECNFPFKKIVEKEDGSIELPQKDSTLN